MSLAVIICVYKNDNPLFFKQAIESIPDKDGDDNVNIYLHVDGPIPKEISHFINNSSRFHKVIYSEKSIGLAKGLNKLISSLGNERYIFRMDSDDINYPSRFAKQKLFMDSNLHIEMSGGAITEFINTTDNIVANRIYPNTPEDIKRYLKKGSPFAHVTMCFKRSFFDNYGLYPIDAPLNEDISLWFQAIKKGVVATNIEDSLVLVRMDGAYSRRKFNKAWPELKIYFIKNLYLGQPTLYPVLRFIFRLAPAGFVKKLYNSKFRNIILK